MKNSKICNVIGREVLDSRGNPTVEAEVHLEDGTIGRGIAPSGASTGEFEAVELRDGNDKRYMGKGVKKAVNNINTIINTILNGIDSLDLYKADKIMIEADGTKDKSKLGANAMLAVSIAIADAASKSLGMPLHKFLGGISGNRLPVPMMNILNGGAHVLEVNNSNNIRGLDTQEFMIVPIGAGSFKEALRMCSEVYHNLKELLKEEGFQTSVGDEGGFAPLIDSDEVAIEYILKAIKKAGYKAGKEYKDKADFMIALDAAASEWKVVSDSDMIKSEHQITGQKSYNLPKSKKTFTTDELIMYWTNLVDKYPIISIEDPLDEKDWEGWHKITKQLGNKIQLVGDDLFVTNSKRLLKGINDKCANSILIKPNQIGTISESLDAIRLARKSYYGVIVSHRSGETEDTTIADISVALNAGQIKTGAPCRGERVCKYNRLLRIEEELGEAAVYPGIDAFNIDI